jgi:membrane protein
LTVLWRIATEAAASWSNHKDSRQGAALAYYSVFSLGPIIVIVIAVAGFFFGSEAVTGQVAGSIKDLLGETGAKAVQAMLADAGRPREGTIASLLGLGRPALRCYWGCRPAERCVEHRLGWRSSPCCSR